MLPPSSVRLGVPAGPPVRRIYSSDPDAEPFVWWRIRIPNWSLPAPGSATSRPAHRYSTTSPSLQVDVPSSLLTVPPVTITPKPHASRSGGEGQEGSPHKYPITVFGSPCM